MCCISKLLGAGVMGRKNRKSSFGPGFLVTAAFIGPGTVTSCSLAGANFGYTLIFALVFATITTIILQEMTGRLSLGSGYDLGQSLREFPKKQLTRLLFIILTLLSITFGCAAYEAGNIIGGALGLQMITSVPQKIWVLLISLLAVLILNKRRYKLVENTLIFLVSLMSLSFLTTIIIVRPDLKSTLNGLLPSFPKNSLYITLALIGTTVVPYNLFLHSSAVKQKWHSKTDLKSVRKDLLVSIFLGGLISASIVITSAVAFYKQGIPLENGAQMAFQLKPLFGSIANILFGIGIFAAGVSSAITAPYAAAFASSGILDWKGGQDSRGFRAVWLAIIIIGLTVSLFDFSPIAVIIFAQVTNGLLLPVASIFLLIVLNNRRKMGNFVNNIAQNILGGIVILSVSFLGIWNIIRVLIK